MKPDLQKEMAGRHLLYIPIIHTHTDLGAVGERMKKTVLRTRGARAWQRKVRAVDEVWERIERTVMRQRLSFENVRVYQDGLPLCGREEKIVRELARAGSRNHRLLIRLMERGAAVMGTESAPLLAMEVEQAVDDSQGAKVRDRETEVHEEPLSQAELLARRDAFIADRINKTLLDGETGILFIGMLHSLADRLNEDIHVTYPVERILRSGDMRTVCF